MPQMTIEQRLAFLTHVSDKIFNVIRFPYMKVQVGTPQFIPLVNQFQERVLKVQLDPVWAPFLAGGFAQARTFNCREIGAKILMGFDVTLSLENGRHQRFRIMEQNPFKKDQNGNFKETAVQAQRGDKLAWVIDCTVEPNRFLGKLLNGVFVKNQPRAFGPSQTMTPLDGMGAGIMSNEVRPDQYGVDHFSVGGEWQANLPDIDPNDIPISIGL